MFAQCVPRVVLLIFLTTFTGFCDGKGSLTYVIDNTLSMTDVIKHVKDSTDSITKVVFEEKGSQIENMVLVTFNDPYSSLEIVTRDRNIFKSRINAVYVHNRYNNWDCPEMAMTGLSLALENSKPGSFVYLFTDSSAKDHLKRNDIIKMCQEKQTQVVFVLTGYCAGDERAPPYQVYYDIAAECSGLVLNIPVKDLSWIFEPIKDEIKDKKAVITTKIIPANIYPHIPFVIYNYTEYVRVTVSGINVALAVEGPSGSITWSHSETRIIWLSNVKILTLTHLIPGTYIVQTGSWTQTTLSIVTRSNFTFQYGFSEQESVSIADASAQPIADAVTRLFISVSDPEHSVRIISVHILDMDENIIEKYDLPLTEIAQDFYRTPWFIAPSQVFKIAVYGKDKDTGKDVRHIARFPVTPQTAKTPPRITSGASSVYKIVEGKDKILRIPCTAIGLPKPTITWTSTFGIISPNEKYSLENGALVINDPSVSDTQTYVCEAKNMAGSVRAPFQVQVFQAPLISGENLVTVKAGSTSTIKCTVSRGVPAPTVTWQFKANDTSKFVPLIVAENVLHISTVGERHAGQYKCIAQNIAGVSEHVTILDVEFAPVITTDNSTAFEGIEGDVALRIPCDAIALPSPVVTWSINNTIITTDSHYIVSDGALVVIDPKKNDSGLYKCEATNALGSVNKIFGVNVQEYLPDYGIIHIVDINKLQHSTFKLSCGTPGQSVRWSMEDQDLNITGNDFMLKDFDDTYNGNYTCRVSDKNGAYTKTYRVNIGSPPKFMFPYVKSNVDWTGSAKTELDCSVEISDKLEVKWTYNGEVLSDNGNLRLKVIDWGHYTCNVTNVFGAIHRSFDVISSKCLIPRTPREYEIPLTLSTKSDWPSISSNDDYLIVKSGNAIKFSCPNYADESNNLEAFPTLNEIIVNCEKQDTFIVNDKSYKLSDLSCDHKITPTVIKTNKHCLTKTSELIRVGYNISKFLETYEVCYDTSENIPLYSRVLMSVNNGGNGVKKNWYQHPAINSGSNEGANTCETTTSKCCYSKAQLISAQDLNDSPSYNSAFIDSLNAIPMWRPCDEHKSPWEEIEGRIRIQLDLYTTAVVWSGIHALQRTGGHVIPRYLWKVVEFDEEDPMAIVYINGPIISEQDKMGDKEGCDLCADVTVSWLHNLGDHVYCCDVQKFREVFGLQHLHSQYE